MAMLQWFKARKKKKLSTEIMDLLISVKQSNKQNMSENFKLEYNISENIKLKFTRLVLLGQFYRWFQILAKQAKFEEISFNSGC